MPYGLPDEVLQGMGLGGPTLPPVDDYLGGAPMVDPPLAPPVLEPAPELPVLPSMAQPAPAQTEQLRPDFHVDPSEFGTPQQPAVPQQTQRPQPTGPMTADQQFARAQTKQSQADMDSANAIAAKRDVEVQKAHEELAAYNAFDEQEKQIQKQRKEFADESTKVHAQKQAYVDATMRAVDDYKVDQNKYVKEMGLGGVAGWGIAMILSGIGDALQGKKGESPVLKMLQDKMHQAVVEQMDQRDQLKSKNDRAQHQLDKYDQFSKDRMAQIGLMDAQNEKRLANMIRVASAKSADPLAQANGLDAMGKLEQSSAEKAQKAAVDAGQNEMAKKQLVVSQGQLGVSRANAVESRRHNIATEFLTAQQRDIEAAKLDKQGKNDEAKLVRERAIGGETKLVPVDPKDVRPGDKTITKDGKTYRTETGLITMRDGKTPFVPKGTDTIVSKFQEQHEAGSQLIAGLDAIRQLGPEWMSDTANSTKLQQMKTEVGDAVLKMVRAQGMGAVNGKDVENALKPLGLGNNETGTGFKDAMGGLDRARDIVIRNMNISMGARGLDKDWDGPPDPLKQPKAEASEVQKLQTSLLSKPDENRERAWQQTYAAELKASGGNIDAAKQAANQALTEAGSVSFQQRKDLKTLTTQAIAGDAEAIAALTDASKNAPSKTVRQLASDALSDIKNAAAPQPTISSAGPSHDPLGYNPDDLIRRFHQPPAAAPGIASSP